MKVIYFLCVCLSKMCKTFMSHKRRWKLLSRSAASLCETSRRPPGRGPPRAKTHSVNVQLSAVHSLLKCHGTDVVQLPVSHSDYSLRPRLAPPLSLALRP